MPPKRKRGLTLEVTEDIALSPPTPLDNIRDMEEFAALGQYLFMFGIGALKLPDFGREVSLFTLPTDTLRNVTRFTKRGDYRNWRRSC